MLTQVTNENTVQRFNEARYSISMDKNNTMEIILSIILISRSPKTSSFTIYQQFIGVLIIPTSNSLFPILFLIKQNSHRYHYFMRDSFLNGGMSFDRRVC